MADNGIRALAPVFVTLGASYTTVLGPVPSGKEWEIKVARATNVANTQATFSVSFGSGGVQEVAANEVLPVPTASVVGSKNVFGPDIPPLPPGTLIQAKGTGSVRMSFFLYERDL